MAARLRVVFFLLTRCTPIKTHIIYEKIYGKRASLQIEAGRGLRRDALSGLSCAAGTASKQRAFRLSVCIPPIYTVQCAANIAMTAH